jgi:ribosomal protein S18 acetylase RimI-like enzyme
MPIDLRPARPQDYDYCAGLAGMERIIRELNLDRRAQDESLRRQWVLAEVRIITRDGADIGWLQSATRDGAFYLGQLFLEGTLRRQGIGTEVMRRLIGEANDVGLAMTLGVVKSNPARSLYERLGFCVTGEDDRKFYMRREPDKF